MRRSVTTAVIGLPLAALALAGCGSSTKAGTAPNSSSGSSQGTSTSSAPAVTGTVTVFAAASLKPSFTAIGAAFEAANPGVKVTFSFGPSSGLATSITQGNPADVFASASPTNMDSVVKAGDASTPTTFAKNVMQIAVPPTNPAGITGLADLAKAGVKVARCDDAVPCGKLAITIFAQAKITVTPVDKAVDVAHVVTDVTTGEVDAGLVYVTDVLAQGAKVKGIEIPADLNASTSYPIAVLTKAPNPAGATAFQAFVLSDAGLKAITDAGFAKP